MKYPISKKNMREVTFENVYFAGTFGSGLWEWFVGESCLISLGVRSGVVCGSSLWCNWKDSRVYRVLHSCMRHDAFSRVT